MRAWAYLFTILFATPDGLNATGPGLAMHEQTGILCDRFFSYVKKADAGDFKRPVGILVDTWMDAMPRSNRPYCEEGLRALLAAQSGGDATLTAGVSDVVAEFHAWYVLPWITSNPHLFACR